MKKNFIMKKMFYLLLFTTSLFSLQKASAQKTIVNEKNDTTKNIISFTVILEGKSPKETEVMIELNCRKTNGEKEIIKEFPVPLKEGEKSKSFSYSYPAGWKLTDIEFLIKNDQQAFVSVERKTIK